MKKNRRGFTLAEVIATVAVLTLLLAIGVPSAISLKSRYQQLEADDTARQLFLAVQNEMTSRANAGTLKIAFGADGRHWLTESSGTSTELLPDGTLNAISGGYQFAIECDVKSGSVLQAYYTQNEEVDLHEDPSHANLALKFGPGMDDERKDKKVGFYNGEEADYVSDSKKEENKKKTPTSLMVDLVNEEDLTLEITIGNYAECRDGSILTVKMYQLTPGGEIDTTRSLDIPNDILSFENCGKVDGVNAMRATLLLDERLGGTQTFAKFLRTRYGIPDSKTKLWRLNDTETEAAGALHYIEPGANIRVEAVLAPKPDDHENHYVQFKPLEGSDEDSSIFAHRENRAHTVKQSTGDFLAVEGDTIDIGNPRHLQNLEQSKSNFVLPMKNGAFVNQSGVIEWPSAIFMDGIHADGWLKEYQGNNLEIVNMISYDGMFDSISGGYCNLENVALVNPYAQSDHTGNIGCLVCDITGESATYRSTIKNCRVYKDAEKAKRQTLGEDAPGVKGSANAIGGIIGYGQYVEVEGCFTFLRTCENNGASATDPYYGCLGGLAGKLSSSTVKRCYANSRFITLGSNWAGASLIGYTDGGSVTQSFGVAKGLTTLAAKDATVGGHNVHFCHSGLCNGNATVTDSYCVVNHTWAPENGLAPGGSSNCFYWSDKAATNKDEHAARKDYDELSGMRKSISPWGKLTVAQTFPDTGEYMGMAYPFPMVAGEGGLLPFYGDWPNADMQGIRLFRSNNEKDMNKLNVVLIPVGKTATVYAEAHKGDAPIAKAMTAEGIKDDPVVKVQSMQEGSAKRHALKLQGTAPGVSAVTLNYKNDGEQDVTMKAIVVVYDAKLTMDLVPDGTMVGRSVKGDVMLGQVTDPLELTVDSGVKNLTVNYTLRLKPTWSELETKANAIADGELPTSFDGFTAAEIFPGDSWRRLNRNDVQVTEDPGKILRGKDHTDPSGVEDAKDPGWEAYGGHTDFKITPNAVGTAKLQASWAIDPSLKITAEVSQIGEGIGIKTVETVFEQSDLIVKQPTDETFPEEVSLTVLPCKELKLKLTAVLSKKLQLLPKAVPEWTITPADKACPTPTLLSERTFEPKLKLADLKNDQSYNYVIQVTYTVEDPKTKEPVTYLDKVNLTINTEKKPLEILCNNTVIQEKKGNTLWVKLSYDAQSRNSMLVLHDTFGRGKWSVILNNDNPGNAGSILTVEGKEMHIVHERAGNEFSSVGSTFDNTVAIIQQSEEGTLVIRRGNHELKREIPPLHFILTPDEVGDDNILNPVEVIMTIQEQENQTEPEAKK